PAAFAEFEQRRLKPADVLARELAARNGRFGRIVPRVRPWGRLCSTSGPIGRRRGARILERRLDTLRAGAFSALWFVGRAEDRGPQTQQSPARFPRARARRRPPPPPPRPRRRRRA